MIRWLSLKNEKKSYWPRIRGNSNTKKKKIIKTIIKKHIKKKLPTEDKD